VSNDEFNARFLAFEQATHTFELDAINYVPLEQLRKVLFYYDELRRLIDVPGDLVEFGVWRAATLCFLSDASILLDGPNSSRSVIGFDTFAGFPRDTVFARERDRECQELFRDTSREVVARKAAVRPGRRLQVIAGDIIETLPKHLAGWANKLAMVICDADTADVTRVILENVWDRMAPGGRIYFDEYSRDGWSETDGVDAFFAARGLNLARIKRVRGLPVAFVQVD
jgi:SAM-dependent methyltransferase